MQVREEICFHVQVRRYIRITSSIVPVSTSVHTFSNQYFNNIKILIN